ncbi:MAG: stage III sporulation protein AG [Oscillospiraceae bacterium]|nr:stage III sporulation protein AG [Oscillospiraceae bacterium]
MEKGKSLLARYGYILIVAAVGALLLLIPSGGEKKGEAAAAPAEAAQTLAAQEREMEQILSHIEGVGTLHLMLTLASDGAVELARDTVQRYSGDPQTPDDYEKQTKTVLAGNGSGVESAVVTQRSAPVYKGALVVCTGGGDDAVRLAVTQALTVLTGLGSDCIAVVEGAA